MKEEIAIIGVVNGGPIISKANLTEHSESFHCVTDQAGDPLYVHKSDIVLTDSGYQTYGALTILYSPDLLGVGTRVYANMGKHYPRTQRLLTGTIEQVIPIKNLIHLSIKVGDFMYDEISKRKSRCRLDLGDNGTIKFTRRYSEFCIINSVFHWMGSPWRHENVTGEL